MAPLAYYAFINIKLPLTTVAGGAVILAKKLFKKRCRLDVGKHTFSNRVVDEWISLSDSCVNCTSVNMFKMHIASQLESETQ